MNDSTARPRADGALLEHARAVLDAQPFSEVVGARITACGGGTATLQVEVQDAHRQQYGLVHGGVFGYLTDMAVSFAAGSVLGASLVSTGYQVHLVGNTRGGVLSATGSVRRCDGDTAEVEVEITAARADGSVSLCAHGGGTARRTDRRAGR